MESKVRKPGITQGFTLGVKAKVEFPEGQDERIATDLPTLLWYLQCNYVQ